MSANRSGLWLALITGAALAVSACGSSAATGTPGATEPAATTPETTEAPATFALPSFDLPSFALPSFTADTDLEALFPKELGGQQIQVTSMSGADFLKGPVGSSGNLTPVLTQLGKTPADLSVGFGGTTTVAIIAFRIKGVPADQFLTAYTNTAPQGATITDVSFGGKAVKKVQIPASPTATYIYLKDDVIWTVSGNGLTDALINEAFSKLP